MKIFCLVLLFVCMAWEPTDAAPQDSRHGGSSGTSMAAQVRKEGPPQSSEMVQQKFQRMRGQFRSDTPSTLGAGAPEEKISVLGTLIRMVLGLMVVLVLIAFSIRFLKGIQRSTMMKRVGSAGELLEVIETCYLGNQQKIVLMRMHDRMCAIGVTNQGISMLRDLDMDPNSLRHPTRNGDENTAAFGDTVNRLLERFKKPKRVSEYLQDG